MYRIIVWVSIALSLSACIETRDVNSSSLEIGAKIKLREWPDERYIQAMDSMLSAEVVVHSKSSNEVSVTLGGQQSAINEIMKKALADGKALENKPQGPRSQTTEEFLASFSDGIEMVRSGASKGRYVEVIEGEGMSQLLTRVYGAHAKRIPDVVIKYQLQGINPGKDIMDLPSLKRVLLPF